VKWAKAGRQEQLALGEVPNIASRIEGLAAPNTLAVSEATSRLVEGYLPVNPWGNIPSEGCLNRSKYTECLEKVVVHSRLDMCRRED